MNLPEYIAKIGDRRAAKKFGVQIRTIVSWRLRDRLPRPKTADRIVKRSPVTMDGIYSPAVKPVKLIGEPA